MCTQHTLLKMDRRGWPWRRKSSEKIIVETDSAKSHAVSFAAPVDDQNNSKNAKYVKIPLESYATMSELEDQVKILSEKLLVANSEIVTKENLAKQHEKVAEEAVSGWEKAESDALSLKNQLEAVTLRKLTAEERASHLDDALKECVKEIRYVKEETEQKLHDVISTKTKQWEAIRLELESKIVDLEQDLLRTSAENTAISRSLQERSNTLIEISEDKSKLENEIDILRNNIQSSEKLINSLKYELHMVNKELEIRNEEKNMCMKSAEVANKQQQESVKKIAKLEAECQRLRVLVRKKLPGPAALAQMRSEVESLGHDYGETRSRKFNVKNYVPYIESNNGFSSDNLQLSREVEVLTARLLVMDEDSKMLKEALSKSNSDLQTSRNICAQLEHKLRKLETQLMSTNPPKRNIDICSITHNSTAPPSTTSMSEDGAEEATSSAESWSTQLASELSNLQKEKKYEKESNANSIGLQLMDDFLEMERLACLSTHPTEAISISLNMSDDGTENVEPREPETLHSCHEESSIMEVKSHVEEFSEIQSRLALIFKSQMGGDTYEVLEAIKKEVQVMQDALLSSLFIASKDRDSTSEQIICDVKPSEPSVEITEKEISSVSPELCIDTKNTVGSDTLNAITKIHNFVLLSIGKETLGIELRQKVELFSISLTDFVCCKRSLNEFVLDLSQILGEACELGINSLNYKAGGEKCNGSVCIDKLALLETRVDQPNSSDDVSSTKSLLEEFEKIKMGKENMSMELAKCTQELETKSVQLSEMEELLSEAKSKVALLEKSNSLSETQLKCMAESYKSLELHVQELETELNLLRTKSEALETELQEEKNNYLLALEKCRDLQEQIQRNKDDFSSSVSNGVHNNSSNKQERDIAAATEKLAQCQETIILLGRKLEAILPSCDHIPPLAIDQQQRSTGHSSNDEPNPTGMKNLQSILNLKDLEQAQTENKTQNIYRKGSQSPLAIHQSPISSKNSKYTSSASSSTQQPEKSNHGLGRFFLRGKSIN